MNDMTKPFIEKVAEKLIQQLREGVAPWQKPWQPGEPGAFLPLNPTTGKRYKGINAIHLMSQGHADQRWMTYKQAAGAGGQVRKGEKGTPIQYWKFSEEQIRTDADDKPILDARGDPVKQVLRLERPALFYATVFNAEQIDGLPPLPARKEQEWSAVERTEKILRASGALIRHGEQDRAFYRAATDSIHLPDKGQFPTADNYYATALHELGHWTGHGSRLDRDLAHPFGSEGYAKEELRAEIASMILGEELGIGHDPKQHTAYVASWIKALQDDPLEIFRAAADAEKIQGYVLGLEQKRIQELVDEQQEGIGAQQADGMVHGAAATAPDTQQQAPAEQGKNEHRQPAKDRQYLAVPYGERMIAKAAGAEWDKAAKSWFAGPRADMAKLARWMPENVRFQQRPAMTPTEEFGEALRLLGCVVSGDHPIMDGQKHRITVEGEKHSANAGSGFYVGHLDGHPAGYIKNNKTGIEMNWKSKGYVLDPGQKARMRAEAAAKREARGAEQARLQERVALRIARQMADLVPAVRSTPYMQAKGIEPQQGVFTDKDGLKTYIPAVDVDGKQWTTQVILEDGTKRFAKDSHKAGCFHVVGGMAALDKAPALVIGEGYATASSLSQSLGFATVAAFDSGNLPGVAKALHERFPDKPVVVAGDDDRYLEATQGVNPGRTKALEAARATGGSVVLPIFAPGEYASDPKGFTDFNDLATKSALGKEGIDRQVRCVVNSIIEKHHARLDRPEHAQHQEAQARRSLKIG